MSDKVKEKASQEVFEETVDQLGNLENEESLATMAEEGPEVAAEHEHEAMAEESIEVMAEENLQAMSEGDLDAESDDASSEEEESEEFAAEGTELEAFESAEIEDKEFLDHDQIVSIVESILFATDKPQSLSVMKQAFKGTQVKTKDIREALKTLAVDYADLKRGFTLEEVNSGYQLRTKVDNMGYLRRMIKARPFRLSGPALEVLSIVAYKQPLIKSEIDEIRGVESGHLLRALMEKHLVMFAGKSEAPGKPMLYQTTRKFLEIFGLRNLKELPSLAEIDDLIPEGIGEEEEKQTLSDVTEEMSEELSDSTYSQGEEELMKITDQLSGISTSSDFFEQEKERQKARREAERAQDIRDAIEVGEEVSTRDRNWLEKYEASQVASSEIGTINEVAVPNEVVASNEVAAVDGELVGEKKSVDEKLVGKEALIGKDEPVGEKESISEQVGENDTAMFMNSSDEDVLSEEEALQSMQEEEKDLSAHVDIVQDDNVGEPESDLDEALRRFDHEETESSSHKIGEVNMAQLQADLEVFDEDEEPSGQRLEEADEVNDK